MDEVWNEAREAETAPEAEPFYNRHYITVDAQGRITDGWSDGPCPDRDAAGAICIDEQGEYQFRLAPDGEENPPLYAMDGVPLYAGTGERPSCGRRRAGGDRIPPLPQARAQKLAQLSAACSAALWPGAAWSCRGRRRAYLADGEDQINLNQCRSGGGGGAAAYPYHLDGGLCALYPAADIRAMARAATAHKLYHTTYYNHLAAWVRRCESAEEVSAITYGAELPEDLAEHMAAILEAAGGGVDAV